MILASLTLILAVRYPIGFIATVPSLDSEFDRLANSHSSVVNELNSLSVGKPVVVWGECKSIFGVEEGQLRFLASQVSPLVITNNLDFNPGVDDANSIADQISNAVAKVLAKYGIAKESPLGQRLMAGGVCDWVRTHVVYNGILAESGPNIGKTRAWCRQTENMMKMPRLQAVCAGYAQLVVDLSKHLRLTSYMVDGWNHKSKVGDYSKEVEHTWNVFKFTNGAKSIKVVSCTSTSAISLERARQLNGQITSPFSLPISYLESQFTAWKFVSKNVIESKPLNPNKAKKVYDVTEGDLKSWKEQSSERLAPEQLFRFVNKDQGTSRVRWELPQIGS